MGDPNALRSLAYFRQMDNTFFAALNAPGPSLSRPILRMLNAMMWPRPTSPNTFSTGTLTLSKYTAVVELPLIPILRSSAPLVTPGKLRSTRNAVNFSPPTFAKTVKRSPWWRKCARCAFHYNPTPPQFVPMNNSISRAVSRWLRGNRGRHYRRTVAGTQTVRTRCALTIVNMCSDAALSDLAIDDRVWSLDDV